MSPFCPEKGMGGGEAARAPWYAYKRLRTEKQGDEARADRKPNQHPTHPAALSLAAPDCF